MKGLRLLTRAALLACGVALSQTTLSMPAWLADYPDSAGKTKTFPSLVQSTYTTPASAEAVAAHYRKLFEANQLTFAPSFDGIGAAIRASAAECDLLITIRRQDKITAVEVNCAEKSPSYGKVVSSSTTSVSPNVRGLSQSSQAAHQAIHREYHDAPAPPLVWPAWLVHIKGQALKVGRQVDQSKKDCLTAKYVTSEGMSAIHDFYQDLLRAHDYPVHAAKLETGQTTTGYVQNAWGYVEGDNYPEGHPGPWSRINVHFSRFKLNEPITVTLTFTPYEFKAPKRAF